MSSTSHEPEILQAVRFAMSLRSILTQIGLLVSCG